MPRVPFTAFQWGPAAIYPSFTGQQDPITGLPYLGTELISGNFADLSNDDARVWNNQYSLLTPLYGGRYRFVKIAPDAVAADILPFQPVGWALGSGVQAATFVAGSGYTNGTYNISSTASAGQIAAVIQVVVSGGAIISVQVVQGGSGFLTTAVPTVALTSLGSGSGGSITLQLQATGAEVTSFSSVAVTDVELVRGIAMCNPGPTSAQVTAGAYIVIQELGICPLKVVTATQTAAGIQAIAAAGGGVTTQTWAAASLALQIGITLDIAAAGAIARAVLTLPDLPF